MIFLDTNFLIMGLVPGSAPDGCLRQWLQSGETLAVNVIVWAEFLCGPVTPDQIHLADQLLPRPEVLLPEDAMRVAQLYNSTGRRRGWTAGGRVTPFCIA